MNCNPGINAIHPLFAAVFSMELEKKRFAPRKTVSSSEIKLFLSMVCTLKYCLYYR